MPDKLQGVCLEEAAAALHGEDLDQPNVPHRPTKAMLAAASLFESYERQILTVHGAVKVGGAAPGLLACLPACLPAEAHLAATLAQLAAPPLGGIGRRGFKALRRAQEMQENMEGVRTIWAMQLDAARNRLIQLELKVAIASLATVVATVPGMHGRCRPPCAGIWSLTSVAGPCSLAACRRRRPAGWRSTTRLLATA